MEILNNLEWYFYYSTPNEAIYKKTNKKINKKQLEQIVFDNSNNKNIKFCFPLNDDFSYTETRELQRPINVKQILNLVYDFYKEPLTKEIIDKAFENNPSEKDQWLEESLTSADVDDILELNKYHLFSDTCTPDFCGIELMESEIEETYFISIGPE